MGTPSGRGEEGHFSRRVVSFGSPVGPIDGRVRSDHPARSGGSQQGQLVMLTPHEADKAHGSFLFLLGSLASWSLGVLFWSHRQTRYLWSGNESTTFKMLFKTCMWMLTFHTTNVHSLFSFKGLIPVPIKLYLVLRSSVLGFN